VDQVVALYLKPAVIAHQLNNGPVSEIPLARGDVAICSRDNKESLHWKNPTSSLCARISDSALEKASCLLIGRNRVELHKKAQANDARLGSLLYALESERRREYLAGRLVLDSLEAAIAALLVTSHNAIGRKPETHFAGLAPQRNAPLKCRVLSLSGNEQPTPNHEKERTVNGSLLPAKWQSLVLPGQ
jgi:hypothetical protein